MLTLVLALLLWPQVPVSAQKDPTQVLQDLLARYGDNGSISVPQLRSLLAVLSLGQGAESSTPPQSNNSKCLPPDTLAIYQIGEQSQLNGQRLQELCPTMLQQLDSGSCRRLQEDEPSTENSPRPTYAEGEH